jgi:trehalose/maltose hydrolase-like predicted phosphorylase
VRFAWDDTPLLLRSGTMMSHQRSLDMRRGLLIVDWHHRTTAGVGVRVRELRLVSTRDRTAAHPD